MTSTIGITRTAASLQLDDSLTMVEQARPLAAAAGLAHVGFVHADAQTQRSLRSGRRDREHTRAPLWLMRARGRD